MASLTISTQRPSRQALLDSYKYLFVSILNFQTRLKKEHLTNTDRLNVFPVMHKSMKSLSRPKYVFCSRFGIVGRLHGYETRSQYCLLSLKPKSSLKKSDCWAESPHVNNRTREVKQALRGSITPLVLYFKCICDLQSSM